MQRLFVFLNTPNANLVEIGILAKKNLVEIGILRIKNLVGMKKRCNFVSIA